jgi:hypothetical protein
VQGEEDVEDYLCRDDCLVEDDARYLGVTGVAIAYGFIAWVIDVTTHVTNFYVGYPFELHV